MAKLTSPVMLMILDGFGLGDPKDTTNAVEQGKPKNFFLLREMYPYTELVTSGLSVGLPEGQMGNSEVGHLNLGSGRVVYQELTRITKDIEEGVFFSNPVVKEAMDKSKGHALHLIGLISDGGVHSHMDHAKALLKEAKEQGLKEVYLHALLDGRDVPPKSAEVFLDDMESYMKELGIGKIATISGRYYGMDRDKRWERVEKAYQAIVDGKGIAGSDAKSALMAAYDRGETDEFVQPTVIIKEGHINANDTVIFFNFRPDRARQLTSALTLRDFFGFPRAKGLLPLHFVTMTKYEDDLPVRIIYEKETLTQTLGQVVAEHGYRQLRIAETEKYAHVTYFFNGGEEVPFSGEDRILVPSPKVPTYDLQPEMSAYEVTDKVIEAIRSGRYDMIILNFANADMVGHTGVFEAAKKAVSVVDECVGRIVREFRNHGGHLLITADHGNAEEMVDHVAGVPHTAHTTNSVPLILVSEVYRKYSLKPGRLCDIAPTMLELAGIEKPEEMTGESLLVSSGA